MLQDKYTMFRNRLLKVNSHRKKLARKQAISCYRLYDLDLPEFPFAIDCYGDQFLHVSEYQRRHNLSEEEHRLWLLKSKECLSEVLQVPLDNIFIKERKVIKDRSKQYDKLALTGTFHTVKESDLFFQVNFTDYLDTGLFLDHRPTRIMLQKNCRNKSVLNLFAYTGSFSVYAASGGACEIQTIDLSNTYIDWAKTNFSLNGFDSDKFTFTAADVLACLPDIPPASYDIIICDPPTFSNSKKMAAVFDVQRDHPFIINQCLRILKPNGQLIFSTNNRKFKLYDEHINTSSVKDITRQTTGFDFEGKLNRLCYSITH